MDFIKKTVTSTILDPRENYAEKIIETEIRFDPLTGETGRIAHLGMVRAQKDDFSAWDTAESRRRCPFCPSNIGKMTPRFPDELIPEGYLEKGEARVIPNISPYDRYSVLTVIGHKHLMTLKDLTFTLLQDAFSIGVDFLKLIAEKEPDLPYFHINWNYMPPSGGGIVHPHHQLIATPVASNHYRKTLQASKRYYQKHNKNFWVELCRKEEELGERFIGKVNNGYWLVPFVPLGVLGEFMAVFPHIHTLWQVNDRIVEDLVRGLLQLFRFFESEGIYSFNMGLFFSPAGDDEKSLSLHARVIPRTFLNPRQKPSDMNSLQLVLQEPFTVEQPEDICKRAKVWYNQIM